MSDKSAVNAAARRGVPDWKRPAGPLNVWRVLEGEERRPGAPARPVRFSIQDVPESRYDEAITHMCDYFIVEEVTCKSLNLKDDPEAKTDFIALWKYLLKQNVSVGAYTIDENGELLELAGLNILFVVTDEIDKALQKFTTTFKSKKGRLLFEFLGKVSEEVDVRDIYKVDKYISALGLSIAPKFRGQQLGVKLIQARDDIGRKYGISASSTLFTAPASQIQASRAGYESVYSLEYDKVKDEAGEPLFPNIEAKKLEIMIKRLR